MFQFITKSRNALHSMTRGVLQEISFRLVDRTIVGDPSLWSPPYWPKGYEPGHLKNNWQLGRDFIPQDEIPGEDASGIKSLARMNKSIGRWPAGHVYYFVNNAPYASLIEAGYGPQAIPGCMVALTVSEFPAISRRVEIDYENREK